MDSSSGPELDATLPNLGPFQPTQVNQLKKEEGKKRNSKEVKKDAQRVRHRIYTWRKSHPAWFPKSFLHRAPFSRVRIPYRIRIEIYICSVPFSFLSSHPFLTSHPHAPLVPSPSSANQQPTFSFFLSFLKPKSKLKPRNPTSVPGPALALGLTL